MDVNYNNQNEFQSEVWVFRLVDVGSENYEFQKEDEELKKQFQLHGDRRFELEVHQPPCKHHQWFLLCKRRSFLVSSQTTCTDRSVDQPPTK